MAKTAIKKKPLPQKKAVPSKPRKKPVRPSFPGILSFTKQVGVTLLDRKRLFGYLLLTWATSLMLIIGFSYISEFASLVDATKIVTAEAAPTAGTYLLGIFSISITTVSGSLNSVLSESQQIIAALSFLYLWLVVVWLMRPIIAGTPVVLRDGLYSAGAPIVPSLALLGIAVLQLLPVALATALVSLLVSSSVLANPIVIGGAIVIILCVLAVTIYWLTGTLFALIIATIPGTYPIPALRTAKSLISGQRVRIFWRVMWLLFVMTVCVTVGTGLIVILDSVLHLAFLSVLFFLLLITAAFIYGSAYTYLLYRGIIDERSI